MTRRPISRQARRYMKEFGVTQSQAGDLISAATRNARIAGAKTGVSEMARMAEAKRIMDALAGKRTSAKAIKTAAAQVNKTGLGARSEYYRARVELDREETRLKNQIKAAKKSHSDLNISTMKDLLKVVQNKISTNDNAYKDFIYGGDTGSAMSKRFTKAIKHAVNDIRDFLHHPEKLLNLGSGISVDTVINIINDARANFDPEGTGNLTREGIQSAAYKMASEQGEDPEGSSWQNLIDVVITQATKAGLLSDDTNNLSDPKFDADAF